MPKARNTFDLDEVIVDTDQDVRKRGTVKRRQLLLAAVSLGTPLARAATNIEKLSALPEGKIDIGLAALTLAKEFYPSLDVAAYSRRIDAFASATILMARASLDPEQRIRALNTVLFRDGGIHYDHAPSASRTQSNYFLNGILDTKKGMCASMPLLYVSVAQRLGYPIFPIFVPDHVFVRYVAPNFAYGNIETTSGGKGFTDASYIKRFGVNEVALRAGSYMRPFTYREFLGQLLATNGFLYGLQNNPITVSYYEAAVRLNPRFSDNY